MKRSWFGAGLLLALLLLGLLTAWAMDAIHSPTAQLLEQAGQAAMEEDWPRAEAHFRAAQNQWDRWSHLRSSLADHGPVEDIDAAFAALPLYSAAREKTAFAAACGELSRMVAAVGEAHAPVWWNLL